MFPPLLVALRPQWDCIRLARSAVAWPAVGWEGRRALTWPFR